MNKSKWQCRWSPTLGSLEDTHQKIWGTDEYTDQERPTVFFGLYGLPDFYTLWRHKGERHILWAGTDIIHFKNGYWLDTYGSIRIEKGKLAEWINRECTSWCENEVEQRMLATCGIEATVQPSFLGDIEDFGVSFKSGNKVYASVSGDNYIQYGWRKILDLAIENPGVEFHLYGSSTTNPRKIFGSSSWPRVPGNINKVFFPKNILIHGRVPKEQMNAEIAEMQGGLRMTEFDGFSEITAKSILMGQWPISLIEYPHVLKPNQISEILNKKEPNLEGREYYRKILNKYPWNSNI